MRQSIALVHRLGRGQGTRISRALSLVRFSGRRFSLISLSLLLVCCHDRQRCRNVTTSEEISPNGQSKAITFRRLCPEEHAITTHVSILRANETLPDENGNVFAYDNEIAIRASWLSNSRLAVYAYADLAKATKIERAGNVTVEYFKIIETALVPPLPDSSSGGTAIPAGSAAAPNPGKP